MKSVLLTSILTVLILLLLTGCGPTPTPTLVAILPTPTLTTEPTTAPEPTAPPSAAPTNTPVQPSTTPTHRPEPTPTVVDDPWPQSAVFDEPLEAMTWRDELGDLWLWDSEAEEAIRLGRLAGYELTEGDRDRRFAGAEFAPLSDLEGRIYLFGDVEAPVVLTTELGQRVDERLSQWGVVNPSNEDVLKALWVEGREWVEILNQVPELTGNRDLNEHSSLVLTENGGNKGIVAVYTAKKRMSDYIHVGRYYYISSLGQVTGEVIKLPDYDNDEVWGGEVL